MPRRDESRLLIIDRKTKKIKHGKFSDITGYLNKADLVVLNDTKVLPAALEGRVQGTGYRVQRSEGQVTEELVKALGRHAILGSDEFVRKVRLKAKGEGLKAETRRLAPKAVLAAGLAIIILAVFTFYLYAEKAKASKELGQKYQSQMDSYYKDVSKTLQIERQKAKYLEDKVLGEAR